MKGEGWRGVTVCDRFDGAVEVSIFSPLADHYEVGKVLDHWNRRPKHELQQGYSLMTQIFVPFLPIHEASLLYHAR